MLLGLVGLKTGELHGNLTQPERVEALQGFRDGEIDFLIATYLYMHIIVPNIKRQLKKRCGLQRSRYSRRPKCGQFQHASYTAAIRAQGG